MLHNINFKYQQIRYQNARFSNLKKNRNFKTKHAFGILFA